MRAAIATLLTLVACGKSAPDSVGPAKPDTIVFTADFRVHAAPDLTKDKFGVYQTPFMGTAGLPELTAMAPFLAEAGVRDLRYEMGWGKPDTYAFDQINGTASAPTIDFSRLDPFIDVLKRAGVRPLLAMTYDPLPLKTGTGWQRWKDAPSDLAAWQSINERYAAHYDSAFGSIDVAYEMWNEPDLPGDGGKVFFNGTPGAYGAVYASGARGIRAGAPRARVGGPAIAYDLSYVTGSGMLSEPVDFVSIHGYANYPSQIAALRSALGSATHPIYLTEYASYSTFGTTALNSRTEGAVAFLEDLKGLLAYPDVEKVYWAQWIDDDIGMITYGLHRKAIFNAYRIYQTMMPVARATVTPDGVSGVNVMASSSADTAAIVLWNRDAVRRTIRVRLDGLAFGSGRAELYRIDSSHGSYVDLPSSERLVVDSSWTVTGASTSWQGTIPPQGIVLVRSTASP